MKTKLLIKTAYCGCLLLLVSALCATSASGQSKKKVAVYVTGEADANTKKVIGAKMVSAITKADEYAAVERTADFLAELSKEQNYQRSGAVDDNQITQLGRQFGVAFVCVADISNLYGSLFVAARMINVQTGLVTATAEHDRVINGMADLTKLSDNVADGLINNASTCSKIDEPVNKKGCCEGLTAIDGACRDKSRGYYWLSGGHCKTVMWFGKITWDNNDPCPAGSDWATVSDLDCLSQTKKFPFDTHSTFITSDIIDRRTRVSPAAYVELTSRYVRAKGMPAPVLEESSIRLNDKKYWAVCVK